MEIDFALASLVGGITGLIGLMLLDRNWYRRENFKISRDLTKSKNQLEIQKMRKELGLGKNAIPSPSPSSDGLNLKSLLPILQTLAPEQIQDILGGITGAETAESDGEGLGGLNGIEGLIDFATKNPEIVKSFLGGVKSGAQKESSEFPSQV
jgi:hypothetical protein